MKPATDKQISYIEALMTKVEARKVIGPKKPSRWNDPVKAHSQHLEKITAFRIEIASGVTCVWASMVIDTLQMWAQ